MNQNVKPATKPVPSTYNIKIEFELICYDTESRHGCLLLSKMVIFILRRLGCALACSSSQLMPMESQHYMLLESLPLG